jgi:hypothetical protein
MIRNAAPSMQKSRCVPAGRTKLLFCVRDRHSQCDAAGCSYRICVPAPLTFQLGQESAKSPTFSEFAVDFGLLTTSRPSATLPRSPKLIVPFHGTATIPRRQYESAFIFDDLGL